MIKANFEEAQKVLNEFLGNQDNLNAIARAGELMNACFQQGGKILSCGNGGSMCDAMHFAEELTGRFRDNRKPLAAIAISDVSHMSCVGNDYGYDQVFERYIEAIGKPGDVLLAISTSGNSANVINAAKAAQKIGMNIVGLTGKDGGQLADLCHEEIRAPYSKYADRAQEIHIKVIHSLIQYVEEKVGG